MIPAGERIWANCGSCITPFQTITWNVVDWDSRRWLAAEGPSQPFYDDYGEAMISHLIPIFDDLQPGIFKVILSATGELLSTSTDPEHDCTPFIDNPLFTQEQVGERVSWCLKLSQLLECDRLASCVDVVTLNPIHGNEEQLVFKYEMVQDRLDDLWKEALIVHRLSACRYVIPFHKFVVSDSEPRLLGYTCKYINDGSIFDIGLPFRKSWLIQLIEAVDELNLTYGVVHQDIAPRNIMLDRAKDTLYLIDFGLAAPWESKGLYEGRNDIDGVIYTLYELLTRDTHFRDDVAPIDYNIRDVTEMEHWPVQVELEEDLTVENLRNTLMEWVQRRRQGENPTDAKVRETWDLPQMTNPFFNSNMLRSIANDDMISSTDETGACIQLAPLVPETMTDQDVNDSNEEPYVYERREPLVRWERVPAKKLRSQI